MNKVAALIPARKGSKGIPGKNFKEFNGRPLWCWTVDSAIDSGIFEKIIVSSDGAMAKPVLIKDDKPHYVYMPLVKDDERPPELCTDSASLDDVLIYYAQQYPEIGIWCILQPTSPLRTAEDIRKSYEMMLEKDKKGEQKYDSVISVYNDPIIGWVANSAYHKGRKLHTALYHTHKRPNRQDRQDWYLENGAIYFVFTETLKLTNSRVGAIPGLYVMPKERSIQIDDPIDWEIAEFLARRVA